MTALGKKLADALQSLAAVDATWTITMVDDYYASAVKLKELELVAFKPRIITRGKYRGGTRGYDVLVTPAGKRMLKEIRS